MTNPYLAPMADADAPSEHVEPEHPVAGPPPDALPIPAGEELVTIFSTTDVVEAEMLTQVLLAEGIPTPVFSRMGGSLIGAGEMAAPQLLRVPASREAEARVLIDGLLREQQDDARLDDYEASIPHGRRRSIVKGVAWLMLAPTLLGVAVLLLGLLAGLLRAVVG